MGLGRLVSAKKGRSSAARRCAPSARAERGAQVVGLEIDWHDVDERCTTRSDCRRRSPATASRVAVPVYSGGRQVGKATSTTWSPTLKQLIALATIDRPHHNEGRRLEVEVTVEARRRRARATVVPTPFYNPPQKTLTPPI